MILSCAFVQTKITESPTENYKNLQNIASDSLYACIQT